MELLEKQLELNNEIRAKEELQRECTQTRQQLTETETYVAYIYQPTSIVCLGNLQCHGLLAEMY